MNTIPTIEEAIAEACLTDVPSRTTPLPAADVDAMLIRAKMMRQYAREDREYSLAVGRPDEDARLQWNEALISARVAAIATISAEREQRLLLDAASAPVE